MPSFFKSLRTTIVDQTASQTACGFEMEKASKDDLSGGALISQVAKTIVDQTAWQTACDPH